jgi:peptidoglycan/LPS O-acetylase OafA/YrhL
MVFGRFNMFNYRRNLWLDLVRGLSALIVCFGHLRNAIMVDYSNLEHPGVVVKAFYLVTGFGHQAVMVFFVLSGYFVGGGVLRAANNFSWERYLTARLTRLWVVLIPCLAITFGIDEILKHLSPEVLSGANFSSWNSGPKPGDYSTSFSTMLANIFFLQTIISPVFGTNGPLWSLANEFWYYMLFPLIVIGLSKSTKSQLRVFIFVALVIISWWLPKDILFGFMIWNLGVAVYLLQSKFKSLSENTIRFVILVGLVLFSFSLAYSKSKALIPVLGIEPDLVVGISFSLLCLGLTSRSFPILTRSWFAYLVQELSEMSYSLYLSHFPLVVFVASIFYTLKKMVPTGIGMIHFLFWSLMLVIFARMMWWLFESRTEMARIAVQNFIKNELI